MYRLEGRLRRLTLGAFPRLGLADARDQARKALHEVAKGVDPAAEKKTGRKAETFAELAAEFLERHAKQHNRRWKETERIIDRELLPGWRNRKARDIHRRDVLAVLDEITARPAPMMANGTLAVIRKMYNWAISRDVVEFNPCIAVERPGKPRQRDRVLSQPEIRALWHGLEGARMTREIKFAIKLQLLTAQRIGEVMSARWSDFDFGTGVWTIPAERSKNGLAHRVPLSSSTRQILAELRPITGVSPWLLPSSNGGGHMTSGAANRALARNLASMGLTKFTPHDLRRTAASGMASLGVTRLAIAKILNHVETGVTAIYDRHSYDNEKRDALALWGNEVLRLVTAAEALLAS